MHTAFCTAEHEESLDQATPFIPLAMADSGEGTRELLPPTPKQRPCPPPPDLHLAG